MTYKDVKDLDDFILNTKKIFLRYDFDKSERPSQEQQAKYVKDLLKSNNINYSVKKIVGNHEENIHYDYTIGDYAFKLFTFDNKKLSKLIFSAKAWAFTAKELKDKYKTIFVYDMEVKDEYYKSIIGILEKNSYKVMTIDEAIDFIFKIRKEKIKVS